MSKTTKIIIIVVVAVILAGVAYWYFTKKKKTDASATAVKVAETPKAVDAANVAVASKAAQVA